MKESKKEKALKALQYTGEMGIHSFTMRDIAGIQAPARIWSLIHQDGFNITTKLEKMNGSVGVRYYLNERNYEN